MTHSESVGGSLSLADRTALHSYTPSVASTTSSSVFSALDGPSSQSSASSSVRSAHLSWDGDACSTTANPTPAGPGARGRIAIPAHIAKSCQAFGPAASVVPLELRLHPRRTQCAALAEATAAAAAAAGRPPLHPPHLVRQCERKDNFVENLVDTTSQMIEVIWPLSVVPCGRDAVLGGKNLIGLRTFIQEVLKRSKTSYSTLQVALYYLVLIKPCIPPVDFTREQPDDSHAARAMQCGRRMFLAALILASKYLQDRNYSARAWSKISGLKVAEINSNEIAFVTAVNWKLHIPEPLFQRWTDIVLKYSLSPRAARGPSWRSIIARLTPALDDIAVDTPTPISPVSEGHSPGSMSPPAALPRSSPEPRPVAARPETLEPHPFRFPPVSPRIPQLPTPQLTPQASAWSTPAVGATGRVAGYGSGRAAMRCAMQQAQQMSLLRCTVDSWPAAAEQRRRPVPARRSSEERSTTSLVSSPESMVSDTSSQSSRSSRSSSISSVASAAGVLPPPLRLAVQATRRCAAQLPGKPAGAELWQNANPFAGAAEESYLRGSRPEDPEAAAALALGELAQVSAATPVPSSRRCCRKRERPTSEVDPALQAEVAALLRQPLAPGAVAAAAADTFVAHSFLLDGACAVPRGYVRAGPMALDGSGSARKRVCYTSEAALRSLVAPPSRGPGMWHGVL